MWRYSGANISLQDNKDEEFHRVHANCEIILKTAEEAHQKLTARIEEQTREALEARERFEAEKKRLTAWGRKLVLAQQRAKEEKEKALEENRKLRQNNQDLQERLDAVNADSKDHVTQEQLEKALREVRDVSLTVTKTIDEKLDESAYRYLGTFMPPSDVLADYWRDQTEQLGIGGPQITAPLFSTDPQALPEIDPYISMT